MPDSKAKSKKQKAKRTYHLSLITYHLKHGFSLVELVLSLFVILALITVLFAASGTFKHTVNSNNQTLATKIATREIENLKKNGFAALPAAGTSNFADSDLSKLTQSAATLTVATYPPGCSPCSADVRQIKVSVSWSGQGAAKTVNIESIMSKNGL